MEYSRYAPSITFHYMLGASGTLLLIVLSIAGGIYLIREFIKVNTGSMSFGFLFFRSKDGAIEFCGIVFIAIVLLILLYRFRVVVADIPYIIRKDFTVSTGVVVEQDASGRDDVGDDRGFKLRDFSTGEIISLSVYYTPIREGEVYEVVYLPHTKVGAIVRKIEDSEPP